MADPLTHVSFDAAYSDERDEDDAPPGRELAERLQQGLGRRDVRCREIEESDYAYSFAAESDGGDCLVMVGWVGDEDGRQWLVFAEPAKSGLLRRSSADPSVVTAALHAVLTEDLGVQPQWFTEEEWNDPSFGRGRPSPSG